MIIFFRIVMYVIECMFLRYVFKICVGIGYMIHVLACVEFVPCA